MARLLSSAIALIAPPTCRICRQGASPADLICSRCLAGLRDARLGAVVRGKSFDVARAAFEHDGDARRLVWSLKFEGATGLARPMARLMHERIGDAQPALFVPAPAHPGRRRARGYDQASLLAVALADLSGGTVWDCLTRRPGGRPQSELPRAERLAMAHGAIGLRPCPRQPLAQFPTNVVICDDVMTTTVTLEACAHAIRESPAGPSLRSIRAVTFASASTTRPAHRG